MSKSKRRREARERASFQQRENFPINMPSSMRETNRTIAEAGANVLHGYNRQRDPWGSPGGKVVKAVRRKEEYVLQAGIHTTKFVVETSVQKRKPFRPAVINDGKTRKSTVKADYDSFQNLVKGIVG